MVRTVERFRSRDLLLILGGVLLIADAFGLDLAMPLDLAMGVPYALVVLLGLWWPGRGYIYTAAFAGSALCLLGFYFSFSGGDWLPPAVNRGFALATIWMVAALCLLQKRAQNRKLELQQLLYHIGQIYSGEKIPREEYTLFKNILESLLSFTESRFGVIGEVLKNEEGRSIFQKRAGVAWNFFLEEPAGLTRGEPPLPSDIENYNMEPLFDEVIKSGKPLLLKYVSPAVNKVPLPQGHRPMESFMGLPFYHEGRLLGIVGVANRAEGYDSAWVETLQPFMAACAGNIHLFRIEREKLEVENALRQMEKDAGLAKSNLEEKDARLAEIESELHRMEETLKENEGRIASLVAEKGREGEEFNHLQESLSQVQEELEKTGDTLRDKEAQIARAEGDRNRTAEALWEKEERLLSVLGDFSQLEKDHIKKNEALHGMEEELKKLRDRLQEKDDRLEEVETRLKNTREDLREKQRLAAEVEGEIFEVQKGSQEKDRRLRQLDFAKTELEGRLQEYEMRLSQLERELDGTKKTSRDRERLLVTIGREIQETLAKKEEELFPTENDGISMKPVPQCLPRKEDRQPEETEKKEDASTHVHDLIANKTGQGVFSLDMQGNTTFINQEGADLLGYASQELIGKNQHTAVHHSRADGKPFPTKECHICNTLAEGVVSHVVDEVFWRKDGSHFPVEYLSTPIWENNQPVGAVVTFTDISRPSQIDEEHPGFRIDFEPKDKERMQVQEKKADRVQEEFRDSEKATDKPPHTVREIEPANPELPGFAAIAAHDLKEPLRKIIGFGSRLKKDCALFLDDRGRDYLGRMERSAQQMQKFIDDLLQYSKVTTLSATPHQVDLKDVIADVLVVLESRIEETHAVIEVGPLPVIEADPLLMHQLFQNLLSNALKFHQQGTPPVITISHRLTEKGWHEIQVEDQGIGFDERYLERIFKPFERLHSKTEYEGTGMGLTICQKIVRRHGGKITAVSSPGKGTTFVITLPEKQTLGKDLPQ